MLRGLISSLRSRLGLSSESDTADPSIDLETMVDEAKLRDQRLRNQAARAIAEKVVLVSRIRETAEAEKVDEEALTSLLDRYRKAWDEAEVSKVSIAENVTALRELDTDGPEAMEFLHAATGAMETSIEDETPSPESLEDMVGRLASEISGRGASQAGERATPDAVNMATGDAGLDTPPTEHHR